MKTTKSQVMYRNDRIVRVGAYSLQNTLNAVSHGRDFYTCGVYGWNADIYEFDSFAICTGYRPFGHSVLPYSFERKWEKKSRKFFDKIFGKRPNGKVYTNLQVEHMKLTYRAKFEKAVMAEVAKQKKEKKSA